MHTISWVLNRFGIWSIVAANKHYSIDVFVAFYITTHLWDAPYNIIPHTHLTLLIPLISTLHTLLMFR